MRTLYSFVASKEVDNCWSVYVLTEAYDKDGQEFWYYAGTVYDVFDKFKDKGVLSVDKHKLRILLDV